MTYSDQIYYYLGLCFAELKKYELALDPL